LKQRLPFSDRQNAFRSSFSSPADAPFCSSFSLSRWVFVLSGDAGNNSFRICARTFWRTFSGFRLEAGCFGALAGFASGLT
jgi:hypothetical protein